MGLAFSPGDDWPGLVGGAVGPLVLGPLAEAGAGLWARELVLSHVPVLRDEVVRVLAPSGARVILDCTVGSGGHAAALLDAAGPEAVLVGLDRDPEALERAGRQLAPYGHRVFLLRTNFARLGEALARLGVGRVDRVLFDLGVSSPQIDDPGRGFGYRGEGVLDMRMDPDETTTAYHLVNGLTEPELAQILRDYGEERWAGRIARAIVRAREREPIVTTTELAEIVKEAIPAPARRHGGHPARRTFQALRIAVNRELEALAQGLDQAFARLAPSGRLAVIAFHSLEDRIVKERFRLWEGACTCPPGLPACACGRVAEGRVLTRKPVRPSPAELAANPRARSAKLRAIERLAAPRCEDGSGARAADEPGAVLGPERGE